ncbi:hypothetical protein TVAG_005050 [Trichomonas vaginalis G3]|uniref:Uncharacterized protein n=1 Tax=Trichomonas vaginalis (strain ATCC PRA-98 / G3) TaxID=412133 RepID=A2G2B2_TRIV3|nr:spectrin binding [Trichomonas vaginalis G3]EAX88707.1 hypothetical protein TVAG_005050 [Trichomonas vaginalis G3]KAI5553651.1 spectrin binding [Trichomonas vaginalis G3]|eukprot:XP_001301637.1 hypothetical protein [Trichomonas vaginalis G3]
MSKEPDSQAILARLDESLNDGKFFEEFNKAVVNTFLRNNEITIEQATTLISEAKYKYASKDSFRLFQSVRIKDLESIDKLITFLSTLKETLKSPFFDMISDVIHKQEAEKNKLNEEIENLKEQIAQTQNSDEKPVIILKDKTDFTRVYNLLGKVANSGDEESIQFLNKYGFTDVKNSQNESLLVTACQKGDTKLVQFLIENGSDRHVTDKDGNNILIVATKNSRTETINYLLSIGFDPSITSQNGEKAITIATNNKQYDIVELLFDHGIRYESKDEINENAVFGFTNLGKLKILQHLSDLGVNFLVKDDKERTPLFYSIKKGYEDVT